MNRIIRLIVAFTISTLAILSSTANAGIPGRFCLQITQTNSPGVGNIIQVEIAVDKIVRNVSSIIGRTCYVNPFNGHNNCQSSQGDITVDPDGTIKLSFSGGEQILGGNGIIFITSSGEFNIDPTTLKGQGILLEQTTDGTTQKFKDNTYTAEILACPTTTEKSISESKQLKHFIRNASKL